MKKVYTKDNCPACMSLKAKLRSEGVAFEEVHIGKDISREDFMAKYPTVRTVPFVVEDGNGDKTTS